MLLLDTNVISELRAGKRAPSHAVRAWAAGEPAAHLYLSAITILELETGIVALERRQPPQGATLRAWLAGVTTTFAGRILPFNARTASVCAHLRHPRGQADRDAMIAATAIEHGYAVVTRNVDDFAHAGLTVVDPWRE